MKGKLGRSDLVELVHYDEDWTWPELDGLIGVVMEVERFGKATGCWVMFPNAGDLYERTRWHWFENHRLRAIGKS